MIEILDSATNIINSKAIQQGQTDNQKVLFKIASDNKQDITIGEIEMRNDSKLHYKQIKFWMSKDKTLDLLKSKITPSKQLTKRMISYGKAVRKFKL